MRTVARRAVRSLLLELPQPSDPAEAIAAIRPLLERVRRGDWTLEVKGPASTRERDEAGFFSARLLDLADALKARRVG